MAAGEAYQASVPGQVDPDVPATHETWELIGAVAVFLFGGALLVGGVALVYLGWQEGRGGATKRKRA